MELPSRAQNDLLLPAGEMLDIRRRLRNIAAKHDLATVIAYAFDHRTRVLPFIFADLRLAPAGPARLVRCWLIPAFRKLASYCSSGIRTFVRRK